MDKSNEMIANTTLATELLREVKAQSKRWFITALVELGIIIIIVIAFIWYNSLPAEDISIDNDNGNANYIGRDLNGEVNNGEYQDQETWSEEQKRRQTQKSALKHKWHEKNLTFKIQKGKSPFSQSCVVNKLSCHNFIGVNNATE